MRIGPDLTSLPVHPHSNRKSSGLPLSASRLLSSLLKRLAPDYSYVWIKFPCVEEIS